MAQVQSGYFVTPSNTPTGQPKRIAVDNPYLSKAEFLTHEIAAGLGINVLSPLYLSGRLDKILLNASAAVNRFCGRYFDTQTIDETKNGIMVRPQNPQLVTVVVQNRPYNQINSIYFQVLKWFIQIDVSQTGYLQDFPDLGFYKIVPLLSTSGTGIGSPLPAEIVDKVPLGVIWTNYTFGYGTPFSALPLADLGAHTIYQAPLYNQLWAPSEGVVVYKNGVVVPSTDYTVDYPNGRIIFNAALVGTEVITVDVVSNESLPGDIKEAVALMAGWMIGVQQNALGATSYGIQTYNISWGGGKNLVKERFEEMLLPYQNLLPSVI